MSIRPVLGSMGTTKNPCCIPLATNEAHSSKAGHSNNARQSFITCLKDGGGLIWPPLSNRERLSGPVAALSAAHLEGVSSLV